MPVSLLQLIERLTRSGLLTAEEVAAFEASLPPEKRPQTAQDLARELILADRLTRFQAEAVYRGHLKGLVMGNYVVLDRIGAGGMGEVLKAHHRRMDRIVALKVLPQKAMQSEGAVKRFYREVKAAARLNHPNIVTAFDADEVEGIHYLVMEFVDGQDLARIVKQHGPMSVDQAVECVVQAAKGLEYAHGEGVIHRDIKPGNLLLDRKGTVKVLDMGLARIDMAGADEPERLTASEQVMGTCDYMAPEQAEDTHAADHRADIYSLGCTFYRLLTGTPPYKGDSLIKILLSHREAPIPSLCEARQDVPEALNAVYQKMLAKAPEDRYQSMGEVVEALEATREPDKPGDKLRSQSSSDLALTSFLRNLGQGGVSTRVTAPPVAEETMPSQAQQETGKGLVGKLLTADRRTLLGYLGIGGGVAVCVILFGLLVAVFNRGGDNTSPLPSAGEGPGVRALSGRKQPPPLAVAPFDEKQAKAHQQAWADYLGLPVEREIDLPGGVKLTMVLIPPGEFLMGSPEAERQWALEEATATNDNRAIERIPTEVLHQVKITRPFYLGKYELTQAQWQAVMGNNPSKFQDPSSPVEQVSWDDIQRFLAKLNTAGTRRVPSAKTARAATEMKYALPTEAQWEYVCRGGTTTAFSFGDSVAMLGECAWSRSNSGGKTHPVDGLKANAWNLYDMYGNVWEWCMDWDAADYYAQSPPTDPPGPLSGSNRVYRGGGWASHPRSCRSASRNSYVPGHRNDGLGFRLALVPMGAGSFLRIGL